ncbi:MAG: hypothetical protein MK082_02950 [Phycisphaerales bacterium]|nr:hypothetical protein [Phycisphaerales bacterium]
MPHSRLSKAVVLSMLVIAAPILASGGVQETPPPPNVPDMDAPDSIGLKQLPRPAKGGTMRRAMAVQRKDGSIEYSTQIDFPGGPLADYVELLRGSFPEESVVLAPGVAGFMVPPIRINSSSIRPALDVVCNYEGTLVFEEEGRNQTRALLVNEFIHPKIHRINADIVQAPTRSNTQSRTRRVSEPDQRVTLVYSVRTMLEDAGMSIKDIQGTLKAGAEMSKGAEVEIKYFEPTSMLFISGSGEQIDTMESAFMVLEEMAAELAVERWHDENVRKGKAKKIED